MYNIELFSNISNKLFLCYFNSIKSLVLINNIDSSIPNNTLAFNLSNKFNSYNNLGSYLAGLLEDDGNISIQNNKNTNQINKTVIEFTFNQNNLAIYNDLKEFIESDNIRFKSGNTMCYRLADKDGVIKLVNLVNGYFRTPKIQTLHKLIDHLNVKHNLDINKLSVDISNLGSNAWLARFTEADGYFGVKITEFRLKTENEKRSRSEKIKCKFVIEQRQVDRLTGLPCKDYMQLIADYFDSSLLSITRNNDKFLSPGNSYYFSVESVSKLDKVVKYFSTYPLIGIKGLDSLDFIKVYSMIKNKEHLTDTDIIKIKLIAAGMNSNRK